MGTRLLAPVLVVTAVVSGIVAQERAPQLQSIQKSELRADLFFLAGDGMRGRLTDTPENALAAEWIKARFERLGLQPAGSDQSFFHDYNLLTASIDAPNTMQITAGERTLQPRPGQDFYPQRFTANARARGEVVFAGFGISAPSQRHDDYAGASLNGKVVLALDHEPGERDPQSPLDGVVTAEAATPLRKVLAAQDKGAAAVMFVTDTHNHPGVQNFEADAKVFWPDTPPIIERYMLATLAEQVRIPVVQISPSLAATISGKSLNELGKLAETAGGLKPTPLTNPGTVEVTTTVKRHVVPDRNVIAMIEGGDAKLKDELVIVCAHYDHNGTDGARIMNGADDDGSGIVGLLEIAEAYALAARDGRRPKRSVMFAAWNSEERGLLGAWAYAEHPLVPRDRIVAVLNMDMIGRNEEVPEGGGARFRGLDLQTAESNRNAVNIIGSTKSADLKTAVQNANAGIGLELKLRYDNNTSNLMRRSDHWPFLQHGVPGLWFHTGLHPDYHTNYDRPEKINYDKMERVARLVHQLSWDLAQQSGRPKLDRAASPTVVSSNR